MQQRSSGSSYTVRFTKDGKRRFDRLDKSVRKRIALKVVDLENFSKLNNVKKLQGRDGNYFRLRMGNMRVLFWVNTEEGIVWITDIGFRGSIYKN